MVFGFCRRGIVRRYSATYDGLYLVGSKLCGGGGVSTFKSSLFLVDMHLKVPELEPQYVSISDWTDHGIMLGTSLTISYDTQFQVL